MIRYEALIPQLDVAVERILLDRVLKIRCGTWSWGRTELLQGDGMESA